jgi:hypothetical protein
MNSSNLGRRLLIFGTSRSVQAWRLFWVVFGLFASFMFLASTTAATPTPDTKSTSDLIFVVFISVPLLLAAWQFSQYWKARGKRIELFDNGIVASTRMGAEAFSWGDFTDVRPRQNPFLGNAVIASTAHSSLTLGTDYERVQELINVVVNRVAEALVARYWATVQQGQPITLGNLTLTRDGIKQLSTFLAWADVQDYQVGATQITIRKKDGGVGIIIPAFRLPSGFALPILIETMVQLAHNQQAASQ